MLYGCAPAHALYFSSYEVTKSWATSNSSTETNPTVQHFMSPLQGALAGCVSTFFHDSVITPLDTLKQRMQLGHYTSVGHGFTSVLQSEGIMALYRSLPVTLATNLPYGSVMFAVNETLKDYLTSNGSPPTILTYMIAGSGAGAVASAVTTPLDRLKTKLQIQHLNTMTPSHHSPVSAKAALPYTKKGPNAIGTVMAFHTNTANTVKKPVLNVVEADLMSAQFVKYEGVADALRSILREEGAVGLFRGIIPRVCSHTPAVAISWTTYETAKKYLTSLEL